MKSIIRKINIKLWISIFDDEAIYGVKTYSIIMIQILKGPICLITKDHLFPEGNELVYVIGN